jgi:spore coat protein U-like protein
MKKILLPLAAALALGAAASAGATTLGPQNFNVTVTLTPSCSITQAPTDVAFTYSSFQGGPATATGGAFKVKCTNGLGYSVGLDATSGTVIGLNYTLTPPAASQSGTGADQSFTIGGSMLQGQSGTCAGPGTCAGSDVRTLTITY